MKTFLEELKNGLPGPIYIAYCADLYLLYEAKLMVKKTAPPESASLSVECLDAGGDGFSVAGMLEAVRSIPFFGGRKVVIVENLDSLKADALKKIQAYARDPEPLSLLFMLMKSKKEPQGFPAEVRLLPLSMKPWEVPVWIKKKAKDEGFELSEEVASWLNENYSSEPGLIASELKKLSLAGKPRIEMEDVRQLILDMSEHNAFDLIRALLAKNHAKLFRLARELRGQQDIVMLMGALNKEFSKPGTPPGVHEKAIELLREADMKSKSLYGIYPVEDLLARLLKLV